MRPRTSCTTCRLRKRKCLRTKETGKCDKCTTLKTQCDLDPSSSSLEGNYGLGTYIDANTKSQLVDLFPEKGVCNELVDLYFEILHDKLHALFHPPSFIAAQRRGDAPMILVSGIMALAARFSDNAYFDGIDRWDRGYAWANYTRSLFHASFGEASLLTVQASILLMCLAFVDGNMSAELLYGAHAIRTIQLLDIPNRLSENPVRRETEIRVWWNIWMMDKWASVGASIPAQLSIDSSYPLPMEEIAFYNLKLEDKPARTIEGILETIRLRNNGLWAQMIPLTEIMHQIRFIYEASIENHNFALKNHLNFRAMTEKLDNWLFRLPAYLRNNIENITRFAKDGHGRTFIALHLGYQHHGQLLYYQFLQHAAEGTIDDPMTLEYVRRCKQHATDLSSLLWLSSKIPGCECLWLVVGHLLVVSSSIHLHTLLFATATNEIEEARELLAQNFELLIHLRKYWPALDISMFRLRAFHRACKLSLSTSFKMDHWMFRFLQQFMKPITHRSDLSTLSEGDPQFAELLLHGESTSHSSVSSPVELPWWQDEFEHEASGSQVLNEFL